MFMLNELLIKELTDKVEKISSEIQSIKNAEVYSTSEIKTNKIYENGKPIYRIVLLGKVFDGNRNHNISNIDIITDVNGTLWSGTKQESGTNVFPINTVRANYSDRALGVYVNKQQYAFDKGSTISSDYSYRLVIEYTKTTD